MKIVSFIFFTAVALPCTCQSYCPNLKAKRFEAHETTLSSEQGGLFPNAFCLSQRQWQAEANALGGGILNSYDTIVYAGILQVRFGITSRIEMQAGVATLSPNDLTVNMSENRYASFGLKSKFFRIERKKHIWHVAGALKMRVQSDRYHRQPEQMGLLMSLQSTWEIDDFLRVDLAGGANYSFTSTLVEPFLTTHILIKDKDARIGIAIGIVGDHYLESYGTFGIQITDNYNYILQLTVGFLDKAIVPNVAYTHTFRRRR